MLLPFDQFQKQFDSDRDKLENILEIQRKAPEKYQENTAHISTLSMLTPYTYYTGLVRKHVPAGATILDWGAYLGQITYLLQDDYKVNAYNPAEQDDINYWHKQLDIKTRSFDKGVAEFKLDFPANSFDVAISSGVLEHSFENGVTDVDALRNLNRILKPGGHLFIWNLPTKTALTEQIAIGKKRWKHILRYELDEVLVKLSLAGFDIVGIERDEFIYPKLGKVFSNLSPTKVYGWDHKLCNLPIFREQAHHFTVIAKKIDGFPKVPATSGYTVYPDES